MSIDKKIDIKIVENLLEEDNNLQTILIPTVNNPIESQSAGTYIFKNKEKFQGKIIQNNNRLLKGIYTWPNGQKYYGELFPDNLFNKKGKIIFPDNSELTGKFDGKNNKIDCAIYKTDSKIYQGSFKNNKLHGKFIIKNKDGCPHYSYVGNYYNGSKHGKFTLEKTYNDEKYKIIGNYGKEVKYGEFKIFKIIQDNEELVYEGKFDKNKELIEKKEMKCIENNDKINCLKIINDNDKLLLGSFENLIIYDINNEDNEIKFNRKILIFKNEDINDFLETKYKKILLCSNKNNFKLIELTLEEKNSSYLNTTMTINLDFHLIQEFKGLENSKSIFCIVELSNKMIVSGDCENIILWDYININNNINDNMYEKENNKGKSFWDIIFNIFRPEKNDDENILFISESNSAIPFFEYKIIQNKKLYHINSIMEIKNENNEIVIGVAEPDSKSIIFMKIENEKEMSVFKKIECHDEIMKKKNIMKCFDGKLFVGCKNKLIVIDINKYEIIYDVFSESIIYINKFLNNYLICGVIKKLNNLYDYEGYLIQKSISKNPSSNQIKINNVSKLNKFKNKGNIADVCIYNEKSIITALTDGKILIFK
jgi:WD40 repeat protein